MTASPIVFDHVWKKFRRGERHDSLRDFFPSLARRMFGREKADVLGGADEFWALNDVSFDVKPGEAFGIIGPNGAGKSTTLKLLTKILRPTRGACHVDGRIGALIEVAAGFHQDLTGRENIFLQGAIMGMRQRDITRRLDDIIEFAGIGEFIDTQVKRYSSGMNARLGFAIAAHLDPDVLIIDEVLSVGDMAFQQKCVARMMEFKEQGVAMVFVSHNLEAVSNLCDRALLLNRSVAAIGDTASVIEAYTRIPPSRATTSSDEAMILSPMLMDGSGDRIDVVSSGQRVRLRTTFELGTRNQDWELRFIVHRSTDNAILYQQDVTQAALGLQNLGQGSRFTVDFDFAVNLVRGQYYVELAVHHPPTRRLLAQLHPAAVFRANESVSIRGTAFMDMAASVVSAPQEDRVVATA